METLSDAQFSLISTKRGVFSLSTKGGASEVDTLSRQLLLFFFNSICRFKKCLFSLHTKVSTHVSSKYFYQNKHKFFFKHFISCIHFKIHNIMKRAGRWQTIFQKFLTTINNEESTRYIASLFRNKISQESLSRGSFTGPQNDKLIRDKNFKYFLLEDSHRSWEILTTLTSDFFGKNDPQITIFS